MARSVVFIISDEAEVIEKIKKTCNEDEASCLTYTPHQWKEGLNNPFFRSQLSNGVPTLSSGVLSGDPGPSSGDSQSHPGSQPNNLVQLSQFQTQTAPEKVQRIEDMEAKAIEAAIYQYKGNLTEAAKALGIGRATLYRKVKQFHIDPSQARRRKLAAA